MKLPVNVPVQLIGLSVFVGMLVKPRIESLAISPLYTLLLTFALTLTIALCLFWIWALMKREMKISAEHLQNWSVVRNEGMWKYIYSNRGINKPSYYIEIGVIMFVLRGVTSHGRWHETLPQTFMLVLFMVPFALLTNVMHWTVMEHHYRQAQKL